MKKLLVLGILALTVLAVAVPCALSTEIPADEPEIASEPAHWQASRFRRHSFGMGALGGDPVDNPRSLGGYGEEPIRLHCMWKLFLFHIFWA